MEISPKSILENYHNGALDKYSAINKLIDLIENSNLPCIREEGVNILGKMNILNDDIFNLLENLLISDSDEGVRTAAVKIINQDYYKDAFEPINWALLHETSPELLKLLHSTMMKILDSITDSQSRTFLEDRMKCVRNSEVKKGFETINRNGNIENMDVDELAGILTNFYTLLIFKKIFWRIQYKVIDCKVVELDFQFKGLLHAPKEIKYLKNLKKLSLRYNQMTFIPEWIGSLTSLEELDLYSNSLKSLPSTIGKLKTLEKLVLNINKLETIPEELCSLNKLKILDLGLNQLQIIPEALGELKSLEKLNLFENYLKSLPSSLGNLKNLEYLNVSCNKLIKLPGSLGNLKGLKMLNCEKNFLSSLPNSIENLKSLEYLNVSKNKLMELPESLLNLKSLKELYFGSNEITNVPEFVKKLGKKGIQTYPSF